MRALSVFAGIVILAVLAVLYFSHPGTPPPLPEAPTNKPDQRARWEFERTKDPVTGQLPPNIRRNEIAFAKELSKQSVASKIQSTLTWSQTGPDTLGGRTRALAIDVTDGNTIIAGAVSGGIWKSTDGGASWAQTLTSSQLLSVTSIAQDTRAGEENTWYAGTGEYSGNSAGATGASFYGDGIYKSTDGGDSWTLLSSTSTSLPQSFDNLFDFVWRVATDPSNASQQEVYAAAIWGIFRSVDGGTTWTQVLSSTNSYRTDVIVSSTGVVYAAMDEAGTNGGVFRSADGVTWTEITPVGWSGASSRTTLALAPSNEDILYTITNSPGDGTHDTSIWKYTHSTTTWVDRSANVPSFGGFQDGNFDSQGGYDLHVAVKPDDENTVYIGGTSLYRSTDGFASTANIDWIAGYSFATDNWSGTHHADQHIAIFSNSDPDIMYTGSDGGVHRTNDVTAATVHWTSLNRGYMSGQFYSVGIDHTTSSNMALLGGTQDNGTWYVGDPGTSTSGEEIWGGDGAFVANLNGGDLRYASFQNGQIYRLTYSSNVLTSWALVTTSLTSSYSFIHPYTLDPNDSDIMYLPGGSRMYRNTALTSIPDYTSSAHTIGWQALSNTTISGGGVISAVVASESNPDHRIYYGTSGGKVYVLDNADTGDPSPTDITDGSFPAGANVSSIAVHPDDADRVMVTFSNYSVQSIWYSSNGGTSWTNVSGSLEQNTDGSGNGPSVRWAKMGAITGSSTQYFVGTSTGLYSTTTLNGTSTVWTQEGSSTIGNVVIDMVDIRDSDGYVAVGTHGNGFYTSTLSRPVASTGPGGVTTDLALWLKADAGITESSGDITAWADQSVNGRDADDNGAANLPSISANLVNYNPIVEFAASNSEGLKTSSVFGTSSQSNVNIFLVSIANTAGNDYVFHEGSGGNRVSAHVPHSTNFVYWSGGVGGGDNRINTAFTGTVGTPYLWGFEYESGAPRQAIYQDGTLLASDATAPAFSFSSSSNFELAAAVNEGLYHDGEIAEIAVYPGALTDTDQQKIQSYLAVKYGISLGQDYLASDGTTLWSVTTNASYSNSIAGIGRDDNSALNQKQSISQSGGIVEIGLGALAVDNTTNANTFSADGSFMIWGHDNASSSVATSFSGTNVFTRMARIWTIEETGTVGTVEIQIPESSGATYLIVSGNSSLTSSTEYALTDNGDGTRSTTINFADGQFFTFGAGAAPGGVATSLGLWLRADVGVTQSSGDVTTWADQSTYGRNATDNGASNLPSVSSTEINYNPAIAFDASNSESLKTSSIFGTDTHSNANFIFVTKTNSITSQYFLHEGPDDSNRMGLHVPWSNNTIFWDAGVPSGNNRLTTSWTGTLGTAYIWDFEYEIGTPRQAIFRDGTSIASDATVVSFTFPSSAELEIASRLGANYADVDIAELIVYPGALSDTEQNQVETYLAIKYGITLGHDYVNTAGTTLWDITTNSTYSNDIAGIGRDDATALNHKQSDTGRLTVALGSLAANNASNSNSFSSNLSYLVLGHDNGALTESPVTISSQAGQILGRTWLAEETNDSGTLEVQFDFSGLGVTGTEARDFYLVMDTDSDPTNGTRELVRASTFASDIATFTGVDMQDGDYVMFLTSYIAGTMDAPLTDGQAADGVLGQSSFSSSRADNGGVSSSTMDSPSYLAIGPTGKLFASDTDNNRVLRWSSVAAASNGGAAEAVLGQSSFSASSANRGSSVAANTMYEPHGLFVSSSGALYVADTRNNRILRFDNAESASSGASADAVLGQADFTSNDANRGSTAAANTLRWPMDLHVDASGNLWAADWLNHRVLRYDNVAAKADGANADGVLGQELLTTSLRMWKASTDADSFVFPSGVCVDDSGNLWVADTGNSRILRFDSAAGKADGADADGVLGQPDFTSWRTTRGSGTPGAGTLQWPEGGLDVDQNGRLWVADRWGDRVIWFHNAATKANGADADGLIGQGAFTSRDGSVNSSTFNSVTDVLVDESNDYIWVADNNHNRVLRFDGSDLALGKTNTRALDEIVDFWLDAGKEAYSDEQATELASNNDPVYVWLDQSRHLFTALADSPPVFMSQAINGHPALHFDQSDSQMRIEGGLFGETNLENATVWAVFNDDIVSEPDAFTLSVQNNRTNKPGKSIVPLHSSSSATNLLLGDVAFTSGAIAELIASFKPTSREESAIISTYLAIKYGLPSDEHYLSTAADTLWDRTALSTYSNGLAGIGRDDAVGLMQSTSKAWGKEHILTVHTPQIKEDQHFVVWGHNGESMAIDQPTALVNAAYRMQRTWYTQATGTVDTLEIRIPIEIRATYLLVDETDTFSNPRIIHLEYTDDASTVFARLDLEQAAYLTFAAENPFSGYGTLPSEMALYQNYPNPFNPTTTIRFDLPEDAHTHLDVYDILGRRVRQLIDEELTAGTHSITFNASGLASGVYFYRIKVKGEVLTQKMLLAK